MTPIELKWGPNAVPFPPFTGAPCVEVKFTFTPPTVDPDGTKQLADLQSVWALVDTGAERAVIDESLVPPGMMPIESVRTMGAAGSAICYNYRVALFFPVPSFVLECGVVTMPHNPELPHRLILGRQTLQYFEFAYNGVQGMSGLRKIDNPDAR